LGRDAFDASPTDISSSPPTVRAPFAARVFDTHSTIMHKLSA
jgi:hypothetical protein